MKKYLSLAVVMLPLLYVSAPMIAKANTGFPVVSMIGNPTITFSTSTFIGSATFNLTVEATSGPVSLGLPSASHPAFSTGTSSSILYKNRSIMDPAAYDASITYSAPTSTPLYGNYFSIAQNQIVTIPVTYSFFATSTQKGFEINLIGLAYTDDVPATSTSMFSIASLSNICTSGPFCVTQ